MGKVKAYSVTESRNWEASTLVFAEGANEAKTRAHGCEALEGVEYTDLRAKRAPYADGQEHLNERDLLVLLIRNDWFYDTADGQHLTSENIDEAIEKGWI